MINSTRKLCRIHMRLAALQYRATLTAPWWDGDYNGRINMLLQCLDVAQNWRWLAERCER